MPLIPIVLFLYTNETLIRIWPHDHFSAFEATVMEVQHIAFYFHIWGAPPPGGIMYFLPSWHQVWSPLGGFYLNTGDIRLGQVTCLANKLSVEMKYVTFWAEVFKTIMKFYRLFFFCSILSNASERDWGPERRAKADVYMWYEWK